MIKQNSENEHMEHIFFYCTDENLSTRDEWYKIVVGELGKLSKLSKLSKLIGSKKAKDYCPNLN